MLLTKNQPNRYRSFLRRRYRAIVGYTGLISAIVGLVILSPLLALFFYPEELALAWGFALPGIALIVGGLGLWRSLTPQGKISFSLQEAAVIVVLTWLGAILVGIFPFMALEGLNFTQAMFESTSGWTTTGLSVVDVEQASHLILLYRSNIELAGGAGLAIITLSAIAMGSTSVTTGPVGSGLTSAEGRSEQLAPHVRRSAKLVLSIYFCYCVFGIIALVIAGMGWFDAVNHAFAALSTGGFSTHSDSIGYWDSPAIEGVIIVLMLLGTLNFVTGYFLIRGKFKSVMRNGEVRLQTLLIPSSILIILFSVSMGLYPTFGKSIRVAIFETITAVSTAGFSTVGYGDWNSLGWSVLIILMLIGGGTGATAGGIKQFRIYALYRALMREIKTMLLPDNAVIEAQYWQGDRRKFFSDQQIRTIAMFVWLYFLVFTIGVIITTAYGYSLPESLFEYASSLSTVGLSIGITSADTPTGLLWTEIIGMFLGRLEFFTVFIGVIRVCHDLSSVIFGKK